MAVSAFMAYFWTAGCAWLYMETLCVHYALVKGRFAGRVLVCFMPLAWSLPVVGVLLVLPVDLRGFGGDWRCWASYDHYAIWPFIGPSLLFLAVCLPTRTYVVLIYSYHSIFFIYSSITKFSKSHLVG